MLLHGDGLGVGGGEMNVVGLPMPAPAFSARAEVDGRVVGGSRACRGPSRCVLKRLRWGGESCDVLCRVVGARVRA